MSNAASRVKRAAFSGFLLLPALACAGEPPKLKVTATIFPVYDMARAIGGGRAEVAMLVPPGIEPHEFEPRPADALKLARADVFVFAGEAMEPWARPFAAKLGRKELAIVDAAAGIQLESFSGGTRSRSAGLDPHVWLDFERAGRMADNIAQAFARKSPQNRDYYLTNAADFKKKLLALDAGTQARLANCKTRTVVYIGHFAFGYFARKYGLDYYAAQGLRPDAEPAPKALAALVEAARKSGARYIFSENSLNPRFAKTIAGETGCGIITLNTLDGVTKRDAAGGADYFSLMENAVDKLSTGLECAKR